MTSPRYSTVLFDLDHTLLDSDASHAVAFDTTMQSIGVEPTSDAFNVFDRLNQALWRRVEAGDIGPNDVRVLRFEQLTAELGVRADPVEMGETFVQGLTDHGELYAGGLELLERLSGVVRIGMVTNGIGSVQRGRIERLGIGRHFDAVAISGELGVSKPDPRIFDIVLSELGVESRDSVVMVGDSLSSDIAGAVNASIDSIWFDPGQTSADALEPTHRVMNLADVLDLVL
ncbi:MAG: YjjG family noncanonical pyrimidine nucleotidase [Ilumatobacter sp.]